MATAFASLPDELYKTAYGKLRFWHTSLFCQFKYSSLLTFLFFSVREMRQIFSTFWNQRDAFRYPSLIRSLAECNLINFRPLESSTDIGSTTRLGLCKANGKILFD